MTPRLIVRPLAEADLAESYARYEKQHRGLGREFIEQVDEAFGRILEGPLRYAIVHKTIRRALTRRFPFAVFYLVETDRIVVIAVLHQASDPERWRKRS